MNVEQHVVSKIERSFLVDACASGCARGWAVRLCSRARAAVAQGLRLDGRRDVDARPLRVTFLANGNCEVLLGPTR